VHGLGTSYASTCKSGAATRLTWLSAHDLYAHDFK
jgi:hypothetical protein